MELGQKIREKRKEMGLTLDKLSSLAGCSKPYLSTIETGKVGAPADDLLHKLEDVLGFEDGFLVRIASMQKLPKQLRDDIEACKKENLHLKNILKSISKQVDNIRPGFLEAGAFDLDDFVPIINCVAAGYPVDFDDLGYPVGFADDYIKCPDLSDANSFAVRIVGDSMLPDYREGDIVVFSPSRAVNNGDDCFVRFTEPHETTFKRVYFQTGGTVMLQPRNHDYPPFVVQADRINGIYKAVRKYQSL